MATLKIKHSPDPRSLWNLLPGPYRFWFDSGPDGRTLFAWGEPLWEFQGRAGRGELRRPGRPTRRFSLRDPLLVLRGLLGPRRKRREGFQGGAAGFWGYETARHFEKKLRLRSGPWPDFLWSMPRFWAVLEKGRLSVTDQSGATQDHSRAWTERIGRLSSPIRKAPPASPDGFPVLGKRFDANRAGYERRVRRVLAHIARGDIYQANLSHGVDLPFRGDPADFFDALRALNPSPYACLMEFPRFTLAGCSPELLLRVRDGRAVTRPIAGTRPRGANRREDRRLSGELLLSPKERAEHIMLVDLERNDLGRVCRPGTVRVTERLALERYSHVTHIVSQAEGLLARGRDGLDAFRALFPGGTITGCPKLRCMEILGDLEAAPRGPFYGSAGWIAPGGDLDLNILIRTALFKNGRMSLRVGAGIVADSDPAKEFQETLHKARALAAAHALSSR